MILGIDWITALIKISFQIVFAIMTAIPFYYAWNAIAPVYLNFLPTIWLKIPYWHLVGILLSATYVGEIIAKLTPKIVSINQENKNETN